MTNSYGVKRRTRHKFQKGFRNAGAIHMHKVLTTYKVGDIVDVVVDGAIHKGMPYKIYHGRTGRVFNINPRSIGVEVSKQVRNRLIMKRLHIRIEHLRLSTCRREFLDRVRANDKVFSHLIFSLKLKPTKMEKESQPKESSNSHGEKSKLKNQILLFSTPNCTSKLYDLI